MLDQFAMVHFAVKKNERTYFFLAQPGSPFAEAQEVCNEFAQEFVRLKEEAEEAQKTKDLLGAEQAEPIEAELVSE